MKERYGNCRCRDEMMQTERKRERKKSGGKLWGECQLVSPTYSNNRQYIRGYQDVTASFKTGVNCTGSCNGCWKTIVRKHVIQIQEYDHSHSYHLFMLYFCTWEQLVAGFSVSNWQKSPFPIWTSSSERTLKTYRSNLLLLTYVTFPFFLVTPTNIREVI